MYRYLLRFSKKLVPKVSQTEKIALSTGDTSIDADIFSGKQNPNSINLAPVPLKNNFYKNTENLVSKINTYNVSQRGFFNKMEMNDIRNSGLLGMIIPKKYGGLEYNYTEHSAIVTYLGSISSPLAVSVMVPNSLGPAELLLHYGTKFQKDYFLPKLANGSMLPCFGLTSAWSGSDAASMPCHGRVIKKGNNLKIVISVNKRYITLAPVADCIGLAFILEDPDKLVSDRDVSGITLALLERNKFSNEQLNTNNIHKVGSGFWNGKIEAVNLEIDISNIIGEKDGLGNGWRMLMECLAAGRGISLPAGAIGSSKFILDYTIHFAQWRNQFKTPIYKMEGIQIKLASMILDTVTATAGQQLFNTILDNGKKPSVISGIMKYKTTEYGRNVIMNSMDILAGVGICRGPNNPISEFYDALPISINVEGNNILTRNLIIFGNGLMKSHPNIYKLVLAVEQESVIDFRKNLNNLMIILLKNYWKSIFSMDRYTRQQSQFVVLSHCMLLLGKRFKTAEFLSGRMADVLSNLYFYNALVWYEKHSAISKGIFEVAKHRLLNENNKLISEIVYNYPISFLRNCISKWNVEKQILDSDLKYVVEKGIHEIDIIANGIGNNNNYLKLMKENISNLRHDPDDQKIKEIRDIIIQVDHFEKPESF
jgi:acyl-CoA dehydrogenase